MSGIVYGRVYCVTNTLNGKRYVGQTVQSLAARWRQHKYLASSRSILSAAIAKYGASVFVIREVAQARNQSELNELEARLIAEFNTVLPYGYNLRGGGNGGGPWNETTRVKLRTIYSTEEYRTSLSERVRAHWADEAKRRRHIDAMLEVNATSERKQKRSEASLRLWADPKYRERFDRGVRSALGKPNVKAKLQEASRAHWQDPDYRAKVRAGIDKPEAKAKQSAASSRTWAQPEIKEKMRAKLRAMWAVPEFKKTQLESRRRIREAKRGNSSDDS